MATENISVCESTDRTSCTRIVMACLFAPWKYSHSLTVSKSVHASTVANHQSDDVNQSVSVKQYHVDIDVPLKLRCTPRLNELLIMLTSDLWSIPIWNRERCYTHLLKAHWLTLKHFMISCLEAPCNKVYYLLTSETVIRMCMHVFFVPGIKPIWTKIILTKKIMQDR